MIVPATALIATTIADATRVSFSAATACGVVTSSQNDARPPSNDFATTAASGIRTIRLRYVTTRPRVSPGPPRPSLRPGLGGASAAVATAPWLTPSQPPGSRSISATVPFSGSKNSVVTSSQPPRSAIVNRSGGVGNLSAFWPQHRLDHRPVAVVGPQLLRLVGVQVVDERPAPPRRRPSRTAIGVSIRIVLSGTTYSMLLAGLLGRDRLVLVGEQHVALAAEEGPQRVAGALVLDRHVRRAGRSTYCRPSSSEAPSVSDLGCRRRPSGSSARRPR